MIAVGAAANLTAIELAAPTPDAVVERVRQETTGLIGRMTGELTDLRGRVQQDFDLYDIPDTLLLREPLPPSTDVDGPGFRYDDFASPARPGADFARAVEQEARRPAAEPPGVSRIRSALG